MRWFLLHLLAVVRGWRWRWPARPEAPAGYSMVSCGLQNWRESRAMFRHGWLPWTVQRADDGAISRSFLVRDETPKTYSLEELEHQDEVDAGLHDGE